MGWTGTTESKILAQLEKVRAQALLAPLARGGETALNHTEQMLVLQRGLHPLFIIELLVNRVLALVRAGLDADVHAIPRRQGAQQADA